MTLCRLTLAAILAVVPALAAAATYGEAVPATAAVPVPQAIADKANLLGKAGNFSGRITEVCQKQGCWVVLEQDGASIRVLAKDHSFAVPTDASGPAIAHGVLKEVTIEAKHAAHLREDGHADTVEGSELRLVATGIQIGDAP